MLSLKLKQGFITKEQKQISSAFKTMIRNTPYDKQTLMNSVVPPISNHHTDEFTFTRTTVPISIIPKTVQFEVQNQDVARIYDFDPNTTLHRTINYTGLCLHEPIVCLECGRKDYDTKSFRFVYLSSLGCNWIPVCLTH